MNAFEKSNLLAVSIVVVDEKGNILLRKREKEPDQGKWELFAGYPFLDEMPLTTAVKRILQEKAGLSEVASIEFTGKYYDAPERHPGKPCVPLVFVARVVGDAKAPEAYKWFAPSELKSLPMALDNKTTLIDLGMTE